MKSDGKRAKTPSALRPTDLSRLASRAAIALDFAILGKAPDLALIEELGQLLSNGLAPAHGVSSDRSKLADPETADLLSRTARGSARKGVEEIAAGREAAEAFVKAVQNGLQKADKAQLRDLRDFAVRLSFAARASDLSAVSRSARKGLS